jgi:hypothetical protein
VLFARGQERVDHRRPLGCIVGAGKEIILPSQCNRTYGILDQIIVDLNTAVIDIVRQLIPARERIADRSAPWTLGQAPVLLQPRLEVIQNRLSRRTSARSSAARPFT